MYISYLTQQNLHTILCKVKLINVKKCIFIIILIDLQVYTRVKIFSMLIKENKDKFCFIKINWHFLPYFKVRKTSIII